MARLWTEDLPDAVNVFSAVGAWRGWSDVDDNVHIAFYEFADLAETMTAFLMAGKGDAPRWTRPCAFQ